MSPAAADLLARIRARRAGQPAAPAPTADVAQNVMNVMRPGRDHEAPHPT